MEQKKSEQELLLEKQHVLRNKTASGPNRDPKLVVHVFDMFTYKTRARLQYVPLRIAPWFRRPE